MVKIASGFADPYSATIADLEAKVAEINATISTLKRLRALSLGEASPSKEPIPHPGAAQETAADANKGDAPAPKALEGDELVTAAIGQMELVNSPMTAREIGNALMRSGAELTMRDPAYSILILLKRRLSNERDVILTGYGKWALRKWFSDTEIEELEKRWGGMGGQNRDAHAERTRRAVQEKIANGESWGRRRTVTAEHMAKAYEAIQRGESKLAAAKAAEISHPTFDWYWQVFKMEDWKPGLPFPPAKRDTELKYRVKKSDMWPRGKASFFNGNGIAEKPAIPH